MRLFPFFCLLLTGFLAPVSLRSQHYYYVPNSAQVPAVKRQHDAGIGVGWGRNTGATGVEVQGYYSPLKQVVLAVNYMNLGDKEVLQNTVEGIKYRFFEIGAGLYEPLPRGTASLMLGYGRGNLYNSFVGEEFVDLDLRRIYIQPGILYRDAFFQGGLCFRFSHITYTKGKVAVAIPPSELEAIETIEEKSPIFLPELGINGGMRLGPSLLGVNICGIFPRTDEFDFVRVNSSMFIQVDLGELFRKKKKAVDKTEK